jgi:hypothetical protein
VAARLEGGGTGAHRRKLLYGLVSSGRICCICPLGIEGTIACLIWLGIVIALHCVGQLAVPYIEKT